MRRLWSLQQHLAITSREARTLLALVGFLLLGLTVRYVQRQVGAPPVLPDAVEDERFRKLSAQARSAEGEARGVDSTRARGGSRAPGLPAGPVDVNRATAAELQRLPGIGPRLAERILAERDAGGFFRKPADLLRVRGIGPKTLERLAPLIDVGAPAASDSTAGAP